MIHQSFTPRTLLAFLSLFFLVASQTSECGSNGADARVEGEGGTYTTTIGSSAAYEGPSYLEAIQAALDGGDKIAVLASGSIGTGIITIPSGKTFEGCGTIEAASSNGHGAIEVTDASGVSIPYLHMTGNPYFGLRFSGCTDLTLGDITLELTAGIGIRFDRDRAPSSNVKMGTISCTGTSSHCVETWNIDGLEIDSVISRDVGECGLLLQNTQNAQIGSVDAENTGTGTGYAALRFANQNGRLADGSYTTNIFINSLTARGGGRGFFCVSESGGAQIGNLEISQTENNAILIENCYGIDVQGGTVNGGGEVRISARAEFANTKDISMVLEVNDNTVRESPCGENINLEITGNAVVDTCAAAEGRGGRRGRRRRGGD